MHLSQLLLFIATISTATACSPGRFPQIQLWSEADFSGTEVFARPIATGNSVPCTQISSPVDSVYNRGICGDPFSCRVWDGTGCTGNSLTVPGQSVVGDLSQVKRGASGNWKDEVKAVSCP